MFIFILLWAKSHHTPREFGGRQTQQQTYKPKWRYMNNFDNIKKKEKKKLLSIFELCRNNIICMKLFPIKKKKILFKSW